MPHFHFAKFILLKLKLEHLPGGLLFNNIKALCLEFMKISFQVGRLSMISYEVHLDSASRRKNIYTQAWSG
jgi:hypothetical protein